MNRLDVNILVYAFRRNTERHPEFREWLRELMTGGEPFGISETVLSSLVRVTTHPKVFRIPSRLAEVLGFAERLRAHPKRRIVNPSRDHWALFTRMCLTVTPRGILQVTLGLRHWPWIRVAHGSPRTGTTRDFLVCGGVTPLTTRRTFKTRGEFFTPTRIGMIPRPDPSPRFP